MLQIMQQLKSSDKVYLAISKRLSLTSPMLQHIATVALQMLQTLKHGSPALPNQPAQTPGNGLAL